MSSLRLVMYGGEPYSGGALAELMHALPGVEIENIYGPAEVNECTNHRVVGAAGCRRRDPDRASLGRCRAAGGR